MKLKFLLCLQPSAETAPTCTVTQTKQLFKQKVEFAFKGQFKDCDNGAKVGAILNWLGDNAYEIYENIHWEEAAHKDDPDHVLKAFEKVLQARAEPVSLLVYPRQYLQWTVQMSE